MQIVPMLSIHDPELDAIERQTFGKGARTICFTAATPGEGVSTVAIAFARRSAAAGFNTLLVDANIANSAISAKFGLRRAQWSPVDNNARLSIEALPEPRLSVLAAPAGFEPLAFRDVAQLRRVFEYELQRFDVIVADAGAVGQRSDFAIPAEVTAAACSATVIVVMAGVTSGQVVRAAIARLTAADANVVGGVLNDCYNPSLADELCRQVDRFSRLAPRLTAAVCSTIRRSAFLTLQDD
jgi:Mrp family chromosome partitioning ATPase